MAVRHESDVEASPVGDDLLHGAALAALGKAALSGDPIDLLLEGTCALVREVLDAERVEIVVPSGRDGSFDVAAGRGWESDTKGLHLELQAGSLLGWTFTAEESVFVDDLAADDRFNPREALRRHDIQSVLCAPIPAAITPFGVIAVYDSRPTAFTRADLAFVELAATITGGAVRGDRKLGDLAEQARQDHNSAQFHEAVGACARALLASQGADRLERALNSLLQASEADYVYARRNVMGEDGNLRVRTVASSHAANVSEEAAADPYWDELPWSEMPTVREHMESGHELIVIPERLEGTEGALYLQSPIPIRSQLDIPIFIDGEWVGLIGFADGTRLLEWSASDLLLLRAAADMVGAFWERAQARQALEAVVTSKNEFLATVSHELRTPLTSVLGMAEDLRENFDDFDAELRREVLDTICDESLDMSHLIEDLLAAARVDAGKLTVNQGPVDLRQEVDRVLHELRDVRDTRVEGEAAGWADDYRIRQVIRNLLTNAVRYGGDDLRISITRFGPQSVVSVADNGNGIAGEDSERLFHAFERGTQLIGNPQPIGLGLAVSRELARLMGGDLTYDQVDGWCTFSLIVPYSEGDAAAVGSAAIFPSND